MIEVVFDYSAIELTTWQSSQLKYRTLYELNLQNSLLAKESLMRYIKLRIDISEIKDKQIIVIMPHKKNDNIHFDISKVTNRKLILILKNFIHKKT